MSCAYCEHVEPLDYAPIRCTRCNSIIQPRIGIQVPPDPYVITVCANCGEDELGWRCPLCFFCAVCCDCHLDETRDEGDPAKPMPDVEGEYS